MASADRDHFMMTALHPVGVLARRVWTWLVDHPWMALAIILAGFGIQIFLEITKDLFYAPAIGLDIAFQHALRPYHSAILDQMARVLNAILYLPYMLLLLLPAAFLAYRCGKRPLAIAVLVAPALTSLLVSLLKLWFGRARPLEQPGLVIAHGNSFPSGHATLSVVVYGLLSYLLLCCWAVHNWQRALVILLAFTLIVFTGLSRIYLEVHYPSDVVAGWAIGTFILFGTVAYLHRGARHLSRSGHHDP